MAKLSKRVVEKALPRERQYSIWCSETRGFGVAINPSGSKSFIVDYRNLTGKRRRMTIGRFNIMPFEQARNLGKAKLAEALTGSDPIAERQALRKAVTIKDLCEEYLHHAKNGHILGKGGRPKKASTIETDEGRINRHIIPLLGKLRVSELSKAHVNKFIRQISEGKTAVSVKSDKLRGKVVVTGGAGTASRTTGLLGGIMSYAVTEGILENNPVHGVRRPAYNKRTRRLSDFEYSKLGKALFDDSLAGSTKQARIAIFLLALTGCRRGEIIKLRWDEVDFESQCFRLRDSKEGASIRPIGKLVMVCLENLQPQVSSSTVLTPIRSGEFYGGLPNAWRKIAAANQMSDITPHTLRHSYASVAADTGLSEPTIASLLGHSASSVTSKYIHQLDAVLLNAADIVVEKIAKKMQIEQLSIF